MKTAIIILSDPKGESEESLGRVFNALAAAYDFKSAGKEVSILFQGAGTRWPEVLQKEDHPAHELYRAVEEKIQGISCACADVFGANASGLDLIKDNKVPKTTGLPSLSNLQEQGFNVLTF
ncbi:MAG: DsrE family protein [Nitrospinaceae bacterium]